MSTATYQGPPEPGAKLGPRVVIYSVRGNGLFSELLAYVDQNQDVVMEGYDIGPSVAEAWGDSDYEYWVQVPKEHKAALAAALGITTSWTATMGYGGRDSASVGKTAFDWEILNRIKERFESSRKFKAWLKEHGIPFEFTSWV